MAISSKILWNEVKELLLEQYRNSVNFVSMLKAIIEETVQPIDDSAVGLRDILDLESASGEWLDVLGKLVSLKRNEGESDESFRERIITHAKINSAGTPDYAIEIAKKLSGDEELHYLEEYPGVFFVWTPEGKQLYRSQVQNTAPAGVLGVPGAAIKLADGSLLGTTDEKVLLTVADDDNIGSDIYLYLGDDQLTLNDVELILN